SNGIGRLQPGQITVIVLTREIGSGSLVGVAPAPKGDETWFAVLAGQCRTRCEPETKAKMMPMARTPHPQLTWLSGLLRPSSKTYCPVTRADAMDSAPATSRALRADNAPRIGGLFPVPLSAPATERMTAAAMPATAKYPPTPSLNSFCRMRVFKSKKL